METDMLALSPFDIGPFETRPDLKPFTEVHGKSPVTGSHCEITTQVREDLDGLFIAMFHADEVNVEAALFANWALVRIASAAEHMSDRSKKWLGTMPVCLEIVGSTIDGATDETLTEVAALRIDYKIKDSYESYYSCQFHPELDANLADSRTHAPGFDEDGSRLLYCLLQACRASK